MTRIRDGSIFFKICRGLGLAGVVSLSVALAVSLTMAPAVLAAPPAGAPALRPQGTTKQLVVDGRPFLMLGGELGNSTASSSASLDAAWPKLQALHLNTV